MKQLFDFFPVVVFAGTYFLTKDMILATGVLIGASALQLALDYARRRTVEKLHFYTFLVLLVFGGFTIFLNDPVYIKWKPSVVNWIFASIFLGGQLISKETVLEKLIKGLMKQAPHIEINVPQNQWPWLNLCWVMFFIMVGLLNIYVAFNYDEETWVTFRLVGLSSLNLVFFVLQFIHLSRYMKETNEEKTVNKPGAED
ncbi:MAG: septation protein IspZ [Pseudomonadales bacterium]|nr:septation protein IspZ [Pseudomonadales bacterium]